MTTTKITLAGTAMAALLLTTVCALAQEPDEATKSWALKRAYQLNGNSMVGDKMIDLSREHPDDIVVKTQKVVPTPTPAPLPAPEKHADASDPKQANLDKLQKKWVKLRGNKILASNVCEDHHMHKVFSNHGQSWRCRR